MNKLRYIIQFYRGEGIFALVLFNQLLWLTISKENTSLTRGYAFTITIIGFNICIKTSKNKDGILKTYGIS